MPRAAQAHIYLSTRWLSAFLVAILLIVLYLFLTHEAFLVQTIYVGGTRYLSGGEIFTRTGLIDPENPTRLTHLFWVNPAAIERRLEADPSIADATSRAGLAADRWCRSVWWSASLC